MGSSAKMGLISNLGELTSTGSSQTSFPPSSARVQPAPQTDDEVHLSTVPITALAEQQLQDKEPPNLQAVLGDAVRNLRAAASESSNPMEAAYLSGLADRFQRLEESGDAGAPGNAVQYTTS
jgi:hypothetical protein